ncbi:LacI family DNA-binding transcriptional regulator [Actinophytocola sp.]|uniref:LacI family DNA-binding transcriptional regulator n=1 Tax=Actinophytocola sp. TaxID=1872138 RepID=UPI002D80B04D|nr:substrate-binding domain-containing protein [Actinophytocola sp.]HET9139137.1 substrate-binding domain-containing protein [Actinophytocola sp.]
MNGSQAEARSGGRGRPTVATIARLAGVSAPTVSRVLNGQTGVALSTRRRVEALLREHGYRRPDGADPVALLELVFHALDSLWALELIQGVEQVAREQDLAVVLTEMQGRLTPGKAWTEQVLSRRPTGVIAVLSDLTVQQQSQLATRSIPLVVLDPTGEPLHDTPSVVATNYTGAMVATRHLLELGHRRIGMLCGNLTWPFSRARLDGFSAAMDAAGVPVDRELIRIGPLYVDGGLRDGTALLTLPEPPTAIVTTNDLQAHGVYEAARQLGMRIPDDLSVVGFDDLPFSRWAGPPMTTVRQPLQLMGAMAARMVVALANAEPLEQTRVELSTELVVRQSTAPPRRA